MRRNIRIQARNVRKTNRVCLVIEIHGIAKEMMLFLRLHSAFDVSYHLLSQRIERWELTRILLEMFQNKKVDFYASMEQWNTLLLSSVVSSISSRIVENNVRKNEPDPRFSSFRIGCEAFSVEFFLYMPTESSQALFVVPVMLLGVGSKPFQTLWKIETRHFGVIRFFRPINHLFKKEENEHSILRNVRCAQWNAHFVDMRDDYWVTRFTR